MHLNPFPRFDWNLRACGLHGHVTYAPDEVELRERLVVSTIAGESWRCLRCGNYVPGTPRGSGPAAAAPIVLRGAALRDAFILRLLAAERLIRAILLTALAYGIYRFDDARDAINNVFHEDLPLLQPLADRLGVDLQDAGPVRLAEKALSQSHLTLEHVAIGVVAYALLQYAEGIGLWLLKRWGEYVAVVGTSAFVPLEVYEVVEKTSPVKAVLLVVNLAAVVYLIWSKRLFGVRGGHTAFVADRHGVSLLEVETAALEHRPSDTRFKPSVFHEG